MDRAIQIPLQEAMPGPSRKKCKREVQRLGCLVGFCLVVQLFMALPTAYLLGAHFREQQTPRQEAMLGPEPAVGKYSALSAAKSSAQKSRTMIHLQAKLPPKITSSTNPLVLHWRGTKLELFRYANGSLEVPEEGDYLIYSRVTFEGPVQVCEQVDHSSSSPTHLSQTICIGRKSYGSSVPEPLLTGSTTVTAKSVGPKCKPWRKSIYLGAVFRLKEGERLMVNVSHIDLVKVTETFFGLASLN